MTAQNEKNGQSFVRLEGEVSGGGPGAGLLEKSWQETNVPRQAPGTFQQVFPKLHRLNVPPRQLQRLIDHLDIQLVFTAHPTEIVRHTIRDKQRRMAQILQRLDRLEEGLGSFGLESSLEAEELREQLLEEIRLWWRTDELHQSKPTVLNEVDYTLHYFQEVLFEAIPKLYQRFKRALHAYQTVEQMGPFSLATADWLGQETDQLRAAIATELAVAPETITLTENVSMSTPTSPSSISSGLSQSSVPASENLGQLDAVDLVEDLAFIKQMSRSAAISDIPAATPASQSSPAPSASEADEEAEARAALLQAEAEKARTAAPPAEAETAEAASLQAEEAEARAALLQAEAETARTAAPPDEGLPSTPSPIEPSQTEVQAEGGSPLEETAE